MDPKGKIREVEAQLYEGGQLSDYNNQKWIGYIIELI
jgi:hypothetical protein